MALPTRRANLWVTSMQCIAKCLKCEGVFSNVLLHIEYVVYCEVHFETISISDDVMKF